MNRLLHLAAAAALAAAPFAAEAQQTSYRCTGKDGNKYYGSAVPPQCVGQPLELLDRHGNLVRRIDPEGDEKAKAAKKRQEDEANREEARRNRALLATYTNEKDIEEARQRALAENKKAMQEVETRIAAIKKRQESYNKEMEFYSEGAAKKDEKAKSRPGSASKGGGAKPPPKLLEDIAQADVDLKLQEEALAGRQKQVEVINAKYDDDKKRFLALTKPASR
jgi:hypothetical protein